MLPHVLSECTERRRVWDTLVWPGGVVVVCDDPVLWTVPLKHKHYLIKRLKHVHTNRPLTHLSQVNGCGKVIGTLSARHCCHLNQSMTNCPLLQQPVFITQDLHTHTGNTVQVLKTPFRIENNFTIIF